MNSGGTASAATDINLLCDALQDDVMIIDLQRAQVVWCSSTFAAHFPRVQPGMSLSAVTQILLGLADCFSSGRNDAQASANIKRATVTYEGNARFAAMLVPLDESRAVLRLENIAEHERELQRHLEDREKLLFTSRSISVSEMATTLAHELNQPIATIANLLRGIRVRLQRGEGGTVKILAALEGAIDQAMFAAKIMTRVRDYTQSLQPQRSRINLAELVRDSIALLDWEMQREEIVVAQVNLSDAPFRVLVDELMLQQVFVNLLRNAIDAMRGVARSAKRIAVTVEHNAEQIEVSIADSGCGLSVAAEEKLFVPFVSTKPSGMGIGLNICRSFIELHQGRLWMSNDQEVGCTFHVALPAVK